MLCCEVFYCSFGKKVYYFSKLFQVSSIYSILQFPLTAVESFVLLLLNTQRPSLLPLSPQNLMISVLAETFHQCKTSRVASCDFIPSKSDDASQNLYWPCSILLLISPAVGALVASHLKPSNKHFKLQSMLLHAFTLFTTKGPNADPSVKHIINQRCQNSSFSPDLQPQKNTVRFESLWIFQNGK